MLSYLLILFLSNSVFQQSDGFSVPSLRTKAMGDLSFIPGTTYKFNLYELSNNPAGLLEYKTKLPTLMIQGEHGNASEQLVYYTSNNLAAQINIKNKFIAAEGSIQTGDSPIWDNEYYEGYLIFMDSFGKTKKNLSLSVKFKNILIGGSYKYSEWLTIPPHSPSEDILSYGDPKKRHFLAGIEILANKYFTIGSNIDFRQSTLFSTYYDRYSSQKTNFLSTDAIFNLHKQIKFGITYKIGLDNEMQNFQKEDTVLWDEMKNLTLYGLYKVKETNIWLTLKNANYWEFQPLSLWQYYYYPAKENGFGGGISHSFNNIILGIEFYKNAMECYFEEDTLLWHPIEIRGGIEYSIKNISVRGGYKMERFAFAFPIESFTMGLGWNFYRKVSLQYLYEHRSQIDNSFSLKGSFSYSRVELSYTL
ncbi:MAG: hypothetical protein WC614_08060 [bacterium]